MQDPRTQARGRAPRREAAILPPSLPAQPAPPPPGRSRPTERIRLNAASGPSDRSIPMLLLFTHFYFKKQHVPLAPACLPPPGALGYVNMRVPSGGGVVELLARRDMLLTYCVVKEPGLGGLNEGQALHFSFLTWQPFRETLLSAIS